jgi:phosphoribosylformimino-5-aminoimidazole carboxamide ribonucleotide (ProFAR) isomerase
VLPVPESTLRTWFNEGVKNVRVSFPVSVEELISIEDIDALNEVMDEKTGVFLVDLSYRINKESTIRGWAENPDVDDDTIIIQVEGLIDWDWHDDTDTW